MEVSLHRTKSILGEKVIRLRHIEKSLRRLQGSQENKDSATDSNVSKQREPDNKVLLFYYNRCHKYFKIRDNFIPGYNIERYIIS